MSDEGAALDRLPTDAQGRLESFARGLERVHIDDLPLYVARRRQPRHRRAVELAALRVGVTPMFERAGFRRVVRTDARSDGRTRWLVRLDFDGAAS